MIIVHLNTERGWRGGEQQMCYLAKGLHDSGHKSHVACRPDSDCMARVKSLGLPAHPLTAHGDLDVFAAKTLARLLDQVNADIVHAHTARTHLIAVMAARFAKRHPACIVHRRVDFSLHKLPLRLSGLKYRWGVDRYIAITSAVRDVMVRDGIPSDRISIVHSCTDLTRFENVARNASIRSEWGVPADAPLVGSVGALVGHKAHADLVDAAALALREMPEAHFVILGEGVLRPDLEAQIRRQGIQRNFHLPGERRDVPVCLAEFDVFCMSSRMEGLGTSVLEAMAMRRPIASTNAGGLAEVVRDEENALVSPTADPTSLSKNLLRLLRDRTLAARLAAEGHATVKSEFSSDRMVERTLAVYEDVLARRTMDDRR